MFQGMSADVDYAMWRDLEMSLNKRDIDAELALKKLKRRRKDTRFINVSTIGSEKLVQVIILVQLL